MSKSYYHGSYDWQYAQMVPASWKDWAILHKYPILGMTFMGSVILSTAYYLRERHVNVTLRGMNVRLISQAVTLAVVLMGVSMADVEPKMVPRYPDKFPTVKQDRLKKESAITSDSQPSMPLATKKES